MKANICGAVLFLTFLGLLCWGVSCESKKIKQHNQDIIKYGYNAAEVGVPAEANPYMPSSYSSQLWLNGWMEYQRENNL